MRTAHRTDANQAVIVDALRKVGASVQSLAGIGKGCPDLLVGYKGVNYLLELKDGRKCRSAQSLTPQEVCWHVGWKGSVCVVSTIAEAFKAVGVKYDA